MGKKRFVGLLVATSMLLAAIVPGAGHAFQPTFTLSSRLWSEYLGPNNDLPLHDKPVLQSDLLIGFPGGFYLDLWHSVGLDGTSLSSDAGDEIDYTVGWLGTVRSLGLDLDIGLSYLDLHRLLSRWNGDVWNPFVEMSRPVSISETHTLTPYFRVESLIPTGDLSPSGGMVLKSGVKHAWQFVPRVSLNHKLGLLYDDGALGADSGVLFQYQAALNWSVSKSVTIEGPALRASVPVTDISDGRTPRMVYGIGVVWRF